MNGQGADKKGRLRRISVVGMLRWLGGLGVGCAIGIGINATRGE